MLREALHIPKSIWQQLLTQMFWEQTESIMGYSKRVLSEGFFFQIICLSHDVVNCEVDRDISTEIVSWLAVSRYPSAHILELRFAGGNWRRPC